MSVRWEQRIVEDPSVRPGPRTDRQAETLWLLEESTERIRVEQERHTSLVGVAIAIGTPRAAVAAAAGMTYDQLRMRLQRGQIQ